jgi:hypothetical protein
MSNRWMILGLAAAGATAISVGAARSRSTVPATVETPVAAGTPSADVTAASVVAPAGEAPAPPAPREPPPVEPIEVLETMTKEELHADVARIEEELDQRDAVRRLNEDRVPPEERAELGTMVERAALMRAQLVKIQLSEIEHDFADYEKGHAARIAHFVPKTK